MTISDWGWSILTSMMGGKGEHAALHGLELKLPGEFKNLRPAPPWRPGRTPPENCPPPGRAGGSHREHADGRNGAEHLLHPGQEFENGGFALIPGFDHHAGKA
jgi:hypothetical protein